MSTNYLITEQTTLQTVICADYVVWLRNNLKSGDQKIIAERLSLQYVYVKQILGGNKKKSIKSTNALQVIQIAEKLILERIQRQIDEVQEIMDSIKIRTRPTSNDVLVEVLSA